MFYPSTWGADALFTYGSGEGATGRLCADRVGIRFETPGGCTLALKLKDICAIEYDCVMPDWIKGRVYHKIGEIAFEIIASAPWAVVVTADRETGIDLSFEDDVQSEEAEGATLYRWREDIAALSVNKDKGIRAGFAMGYNAALRARDMADTDTDSLREKLLKKYEAQKLPEGISGRYEAVYRRCLSVIEGSVYADGSRRVFAKRGPHGLYINTRQAMLSAAGLKDVFPDVALSTVLYLTGFVDERGILPAVITGGAGDSSCAAPLLPWAFYEVAGESKELIEENYDTLRRHVMYYINERDMNKNNLYHWLAGGKNNPGADSGMENSPRFDENVIVDGADLGAYLHLSVVAMRKMSEIINKNNDILYWGVMAERIRLGVNNFLFDDTDRFYYDRGVIGKKLNKTKTVAGLMPIFGEICPPGRLTQLMEHMSDRGEFGTRYGVPSVARCEESFSSDMYRGAVYFEENYKLARGLCAAGKADKAAEVVSRCLEAACRGYETGGVIYEYYNPVSVADTPYQRRQGMGGGNMSLFGYNTCIRDCAASASFIVAMINLLSARV